VGGVIRDAQTGVPLPDAVVRFVGVPHNALLADNRGEFRSAPLGPGAVIVEASRGDHLTSRQVAWVRAGETALLDLKLPPIERPALGRLSLDLHDEAGGPLLATATLSRDGQILQLLPQAGGQPASLTARVPAGPWTLRVDAGGYLSREQTVVLPSGGEQRLSLPLLRRPAVPHVQLGAGEILLGEPLEFQPSGAALAADSARVLDEVIDLLIHHPELHQLRIEHQGYLGQRSADDASPPAAPLLALWEQQAIAVRDYLVQRGVTPERVVAQVTPQSPLRGRSPRILLKVAAEPPAKGVPAKRP
jgi:outer membrane protein OmpA-like peptidoglycan-associated protein